MRKALPIVLFIVAIGKVAFAQNLYRTEFLGRPTDSSITVKLFFADSAEVQVQYGTSPGVYSSQTSWQLFADSVPASIILSGLMPDTKYYYRVRHRLPNGGQATNRQEYSFHTARRPGSAFVFVVQADPHLDENSDTALYRLCLQNQLEDQPDFMIDLGDYLMTEKLKDTATNSIPFDTLVYRCNLLRSYYESECHSVPLFIANGNHEGESGWYLDGTPNNLAVWSNNERKKYFLNPAVDYFYSGDTTNYPFVGRRDAYYSWTWGDAQFIVLDPFWYTTQKPDSLHGWYWSLGETQYNWLKTTLQNSVSTYKFVFAHHIIGGDPQGRGGTEYANFYEWGGENKDSTSGFAVNRPGWYKPIKDLLEENRVNIFFHGHDHFFDRQQLNCMIYQETPQPSLHNFNYPNQAAQYGYLSGLIKSNSGHLRVTVDSSGTLVEYVRVYLPSDTNSTHHNKDVAASYYISRVNCYDSLSSVVPIVWNSNYEDEIAFPNPFSRETTIRFSLQEEARVYVDIYSSEGKLIRRLLNGQPVSNGDHLIIWDGKDGSGNDVISGVYHYTVRYDHFSKGGAVILQR